MGVAAKIRSGNIPNKIQNHKLLKKFEPSAFYNLKSKNQILARIVVMRKKNILVDLFCPLCNI
jgi:hypothetical protein